MPDRRTAPATLEDLITSLLRRVDYLEEQQSRLEGQINSLTSQLSSLASRVTTVEPEPDPVYPTRSDV